MVAQKVANLALSSRDFGKFPLNLLYNLNLVFLINIIRVLWTKLRATHANEPSQFRKAVRATLVLVPLFGLHFILVMYRPQNGDCFVLEGYSYFSYAMDGLQVR
ncbi:uncharacterized protein TNCV_3281551 [Trichonephila clavipes]|nr:uncharacterized protein TNCV_3281551 [Trichonephila clavipes]